MPLASALAGGPTSFVRVDVALDGEPVIGSFTVDGLTFAVTEGASVELVGVSFDWQQVAGSQDADGSPVAPMPASGPDGLDADRLALAISESVAYGGVDYAVASIGAYAFYLSGVASVELPASVANVDERAFRSSDVASVAVADGNPTYSSFDGALYSADYSRLLLIPEGKQGAVRMPSAVVAALPSAFSHCAGVDAISADAGGAAFASENGLLYDASLTTLIRVPAGATDIAIRDGCTTIAAGAMEGCAKLTSITAPASVTSVSPDVFTSVPTVSLPAASVADDGAEDEAGAAPRRVVASSQGLEAPLALPDLGSASASSSVEASGTTTTQLTAMVALSSTDDDLPEVDPAAIEVSVLEEMEATLWQALGFSVCELPMENGSMAADLERQGTFYAVSGIDVYFNGGTIVRNGTTYPVITFKGDAYVAFNGATITYPLNSTAQNPGCEFRFWGTSFNATSGFTSRTIYSGTGNYFAIWNVPITWDPNGGHWGDSMSDQATKESTHSSNSIVSGYNGSEVPQRSGYIFTGWESSEDGDIFPVNTNVEVLRKVTYVAQWEPITLDFETSEEPGDEDYPGEEKPSVSTPDAVDDNGKIEIADPKRPGYVFQGWVIPDADGEHAIDQDLVYQDETDGKWYVDASKLPDYANDEGRVELTARWTSVISVDVPSVATFYYDLVTDQSGEAHEAALSGTTSFSSQSQVDLRVCGLESVKAEGADSLFASGADGAVMSVYPATGGNAVTVEGAQGAAGAKPASAVDFALDDVVLEGAFAKAGSDAFAIPAGDDLTLTYRLNLGTGATLDYDRILAMAEGDEASLASLTYTFAPVHAHLNPDGTVGSDVSGNEVLYDASGNVVSDEPLYLVQDGYWWGLDKIKDAANCIAETDAASPCAAFYDRVMRSVSASMVIDPAADSDSEHFFQMLIGGRRVPVQLIGICDDTRTDGSKAGMTFMLKNACATLAPFALKDNAAIYGWNDGSHANSIRSYLRGEFWDSLAPRLRSSIVEVRKFQQVYEAKGSTNVTTAALQGPTAETVFLPSSFEVFGDPRRSASETYMEPFYDWYGSECLGDAVRGYAPFRYDWFALGTRTGNLIMSNTSRLNADGDRTAWWTRTGSRGYSYDFNEIGANGKVYGDAASAARSVIPCFAL